MNPTDPGEPPAGSAVRPSLDDLLKLGAGRGEAATDEARGPDGPAGGTEAVAAAAGGRGGPGDRPVAGPTGERDRLATLAIDSIVPNEYQPRRRFEEGSLQALSDSIRAVGVLQPVIVRPLVGDRYELIAGERRWRAARRAGLSAVPAVVRIAGNRRSLEESIVENLHREDLNAIEEAAAYQQLIEDFGLTQDEVASRVGKSRSAVANTLRLFQLPSSVQRMVVEGELSAGHARALVALGEAGAQRRLAARIVTEELSVREVEALIKGRGGADGRRDGRSSSAGEPGKSVSALEVERLLADHLETRVEVFESSGNGRIVLRFADRDDLARLFQRLLGVGSDGDVGDRSGPDGE